MWGIKKTMPSSVLITIVLLGMVTAACDHGKSETYTVGVMNTLPTLEQTLTGFKEGLRELGYTEGKKIRYIYDGPTMELDKLSAAAQSLVAAKVDLILSITTPATLAAKQATTGIGLPVVFAVVTDPLGAGIVDSLQHPGGNLTGVAFGIAEARRLEWLVKIAPEIRHIYVPFNPKDKAPVLALKMMREAAAKLGVKLITREVYNPESLDEAVFNIPLEADAVLLLPDSFRGTRLVDMVTTATKRHLPTSVSNISTVKTHNILTSFGLDQHLCGEQAARLADRIFRGASPADVPAEMAELFLAINLKTAETIGLTIPDEILRQAHILVR